ncbi:unnamed protein product [Pleuronectes platessa]|uniref:Uncharacterized protein n=1 Tax=Pleuronectes platessa TaxID=8262 RepID=A0A9N7YXW1_PLEPL|nr:unnamed protein product [Pleuronectes platessa]
MSNNNQTIREWEVKGCKVREIRVSHLGLPHFYVLNISQNTTLRSGSSPDPPTRHGCLPNRSGNEVLSSLAASDTETLDQSGRFGQLQGSKAQRGLMVRLGCPIIVLHVFSLFTQTASTQDILYPYGPGNRDLETPKMDDGSSPEISLLIPFVFFNIPYRSIYVNNNGVISFNVQMCTTASAEMSITENPPSEKYWKGQRKMSGSTSRMCPPSPLPGSLLQHGTRSPSMEEARQPQ